MPLLAPGRSAAVAVHPLSLTPLHCPASKPNFLVQNHRRRVTALAAAAPPASSDEFVISLADKLEDSVTYTTSPALQLLRESAVASLVKSPWPSRKNDAFRFTDMSYLKKRPVDPIAVREIQPLQISSPFSCALVIVDGQLSVQLSTLGSLPDGVFVGNMSLLPAGHVYDRVAGAIASNANFIEKDLFWDFNGLGAPDVTVIYIPEGVVMVEEPLHLQFVYSKDREGDAMVMSNPRVLVVVEQTAELAIVEEHFGVGEGGDGCYWANVVVEIMVEEAAKVSHSYVQRQEQRAAHVKWTHVCQKQSSKYELVEVSTGGRLSRHNLHIQQEGPETTTELSTFHLSSKSSQIQDLHSRLVLDHPRGFSRQLHKCIVCDSGRGIFDGNIRVNRLAQQTDAGQQTKSLLLSPEALVNVKPNLQIIADDVKCAHGAAISGEFDTNELFYFRARGIDRKTAIESLTFSFGAQVINHIPYKAIQKNIGNMIQDLLRSSKKYIE